MLLSQANRSVGREDAGSSRFVRWTLGLSAKAMLRNANGRVLVWGLKDDPELAVVMATLQIATPQLRASRAMMPMEYDDTESFRGTYLGVGEKLVMTGPDQNPPFVLYTWDVGTHLIEVRAVSGDGNRFGTVFSRIDDLVRSVRTIEEVSTGESAETLQLPPS